MRHIKLYESYLKGYSIDRGSTHEISNLDNNWILKVPFNSKIQSNTGFHGPIHQKEVLKKFRDHISTMKKWPEIFPKVKMLDRYRAIVERLNGREADDQIDLIRSFIFKEKFELFPIEKIYHSAKLLETLGSEDNDICRKWYLFLINLKKSDIEEYINRNLDLSDDNFGIDKEGNIKLLDF